MASDKLMNHTQGETIITKLTSIADSLDDLAAVTPAKLGMGIATCDTPASTAAKTAALANFALVEGAPVSVQFTYANTATNATLNINNTGAKPIFYKDAAIGNDVISAGDTCTFIYTTNTYKITNIDTLTGPGSGTVRQVGAENGLITDQNNNADIQTTGKIGLKLKSDTAFSTEVGAHNTSTDNMYPVALDSEGHPVAAISNFVGSGSGHKAGLVPDTGSSTAGTAKYLREDASWIEPTGDNLKLTGYEIESQAAAVAATDTINEGIGKLEYKVNANQTNILSVEDMVCDNEFDTTTAYAVGDIVTYEHGLYEFTSAHSAGAWNSNHVTRIDVVGYVDSQIPTVMGASGSSHKGGLVPDTPSTSGTSKFLREDGTWAAPSGGAVNTVYIGTTQYPPDSNGKVSLPAYPTTLPASDVYSWAKASSKPTYTASEVGLGNVGNFKAVSTVASQGLSDTEKANARANIGAGTSSFSGSYSDLSGKPTLGTAAAKDVPSSGNASTSQIVMGNDSRLSDARTPTSHTHTKSQITDFPTSMPASDVSAWAKASTKPTYTASEVGAVPNTAAGVSAAINQLTTGDSAPTDNDYYVSQYAGGGTSTTTYHRRPVSKLWEYIKSKLASKGSATQPVYFSNGLPVATTYTLGKSVPADAKFTDTTYSAATTSAAGLMSATDKTKLDGIATGAQVNSITGVKGNSEQTYRTGNVNLTAANIGAAASSHTHNYAGSSSAGGAATSAIKLKIKSVRFKTPKVWINKSWSGLTKFSGSDVWTDGTNVYYSSGTTQRVFTGSSWSTKTWSGLTSFNGSYIWTDGTNIYFSGSSSQYVLSGSTWSTKTWSGYTSIDGTQVWTDGKDIYYSYNSKQYVLSGSTWSTKTWSGLTSFMGYNVWSDGVDIYYSSGSNQYVLNKSTYTWTTKTWSGLTNFDGTQVWTDGTDIYYSANSSQYVLNGSTWIAKSWSGLQSFLGGNIWTDGTNVYYSNNSAQYVLTQMRSVR